MSAVAEHFEALQSHLAQGQTRAERLSRLLGSLWDETGKPTLMVLPEARSLLSASLAQASDDAAGIGIETFDTRWTGIVALLHNASTYVRTATASDAGEVAALLHRLRQRVLLLRNRRAEPISIRLH